MELGLINLLISVHFHGVILALSVPISKFAADLATDNVAEMGVR